MSNPLAVKIGDLSFRSNVFGSSGCFGHAYELAEYTDLTKLGAVTPKTSTFEPRPGNPPPRIWEVPAATLTSIGLQGPGIDVDLELHFAKIKAVLDPDQIFYSIAANRIADYISTGLKLAAVAGIDDIAAVELNCACPNVTLGGGSFSKEPLELEKLVSTAVRELPFKIIAKINTNSDSYCDAARACEAAGALAVYTSNTPLGMAIDIKNRKPALGNIKGPVNGHANLPIGICKTWDIYKAVKIPIIGSGGITNYQDALQYIMAGATAVGIGSATFLDPDSAVQIVKGLELYCANNNIRSITELIGCAHQQ
jgi:dihydroorotate dehydrogenase (NAD+) catalytic subunit